MKNDKASDLDVADDRDFFLEFGKYYLRVLSELLADRPFFLGNEPSLLDMIVFTNLSQLSFIDNEVVYPLLDAMNQTFPNLAGLVSRIHDWENISTSLERAMSLNAARPPTIGNETDEETDSTEEPQPGVPANDKDDEKEKEEEKTEEKKEDNIDTEKEQENEPEVKKEEENNEIEKKTA